MYPLKFSLFAFAAKSAAGLFSYNPILLHLINNNQRAINDLFMRTLIVIILLCSRKVVSLIAFQPAKQEGIEHDRKNRAGQYQISGLIRQ